MNLFLPDKEGYELLKDCIKSAGETVSILHKIKQKRKAMTNKDNIPTPARKVEWSDEFEAGRQDVIASLEETFLRRQKFVISLRDTTENMAYSKEKRDGIEIAYKEILSSLQIEKSKRTDINRIA